MAERRPPGSGPEVTETELPGVGVRHEFATANGERVAVLFRRSGHREVLVYDSVDRDSCSTVLHLGPDEAYALAEILRRG